MVSGPGSATSGTAKSRLSNRLYDDLRGRIISGEYAQGQRLVETNIAAELQVSRIPLREAMPRLAVDGFVQILPRRGAQVTTWSRQLVDELFDARIALEVRAAALAARRAQHDLSFRDHLDERVLAARKALESMDSIALATTHASLHQALVDAAGNALLSSLMEAVSGRLTWMYHLTSQNDQTDAVAEHDAILDAIYAGNERLAEARVYTHIEAGREPSMATVETGSG